MCCTASLRSRSSRFHRGFTCFEIQDFNKRERLRVLVGKLKKSAGCTWNLIQATPSYTICPSVFCVSEKSAAEVCDVRTPYAPHLLELWLPALTVPLDAAWTSILLDVHDSLMLVVRLSKHLLYCGMEWRYARNIQTRLCGVLCVCHFMALHGQGARDARLKRLKSSHWWAWTIAGLIVNQ